MGMHLTFIVLNHILKSIKQPIYTFFPCDALLKGY